MVGTAPRSDNASRVPRSYAVIGDVSSYDRSGADNTELADNYSREECDSCTNPTSIPDDRWGALCGTLPSDRNIGIDEPVVASDHK